MEVTGIILAGGKSLRLGRNKATETIGGVPVIERVINRLKPITNRLILVTDKGNKSFSSIKSVEIVTDIHPEKGPLGGIYTGLCNSRTIANIVVACDMPFLNASLLEHMSKLLPSFDAIVPRWPGGKIEPLHAVYSISCLPTMKKQLENEQLSIFACLKKMHVLHLNKRGFSEFDAGFLSFFNINTQADIDMANQLAARESQLKPRDRTLG
ncbi:MAG: molybdenum cofactor guanylyltransferase [Dehalococcoidales bacterium]|nr:molybdenum cofactor guanylyltransferase [Dehalococcoidales bacterium]